MKPVPEVADVPGQRPRWTVVCTLGLAQIFAWGTSYYLPTILAAPIAASTGWAQTWVAGGLSLGLLVSGLVSPRVGRTIEHLGGRPVLGASAVLLAAGLLGLAVARTASVYLAAWVVIGLGMGAGLYDPAFAALGRIYGEAARPLITGVTLWGGFASTVCWPLSAFLVSHIGWRGACLAYASLHLAGTLPLYLFGLPREIRRIRFKPTGSAGIVPAAPALADGADRRQSGAQRYAFTLLAASMTLAALITTIFAVELVALLHARGVSAQSAVALGALFGPSQVAARVLEHLLARRRHPVWSLLASLVLAAAGLAMLLLGPGLIAVGLMLYGAGGGIRSIARATVPLALFGREEYAALIGRLAMPMLVAQAAAPAIGALLLTRLGGLGLIVALVGLAVVNVLPVLLLVPFALRPAGVRQEGAGTG